MVVLIKCININIYFHKVHLQCLKAVMEYAIEPMQICLHKSCYTTRFWELRKVLELRVTCLMFGICNFHIHKMFNSLLYLGTFGKLRFDYLEKGDYTDCKFICGVADEGIMKYDRLKWGLVTIRHSSLSLDMKYIEYRVTNCIMAV